MAHIRSHLTQVAITSFCTMVPHCIMPRKYTTGGSPKGIQEGGISVHALVTSAYIMTSVVHGGGTAVCCCTWVHNLRPVSSIGGRLVGLEKLPAPTCRRQWGHFLSAIPSINAPDSTLPFHARCRLQMADYRLRCSSCGL